MSQHSLRLAAISAEGLVSNIQRVLNDSVPIDVSGNAYGHGGVAVARLADDLGAQLWVARTDDADRLRSQGVTSDILRGDVGAVPARDEVYGFVESSAPIMTLRGRVLMTKPILSGEGVSYGYTFRAPHDGRTALVSLGYGDGIHRRAGNLSSVHVGGARYPIVGRVAMNVCVIFVEPESAESVEFDGDSDIREGAEVVFFGNPAVGHPSLNDWSARLGERALSVTSGIADRVERVLS